MSLVVDVRLESNGRIYTLDAKGFEDLTVGDKILAGVDSCTEFGSVCRAPYELKIEDLTQELGSILRRASAEDEEKYLKLQHDNCMSKHKVMEKVKDHGLEMKLVSVRHSFDGKKVYVLYTAEDRVDFRALVKDLAGMFHARVEMRQINERDEASILGGFGPCGQCICCKRFLNEPRQVSIKMAKVQGIALNPNKINGICGKLMCCLQYEYSGYRDVVNRMPKLGGVIETPQGTGMVIFHDLLNERVGVKFKGGEDDRIEHFTLEELGINAPADGEK